MLLFSILPLGLIWSLFERRRKGEVTLGILPLLAALAPVAISAVRSALNRRGQNSQATAAQHEAERQAGFQQKSAFYNPQAVQARNAERTMATMQLGRLAGHFGGLDRVPAALRSMLQQRRQEQTFQFEPGAVAQQPRAPGGIGTDILEGLQNFDVGRYNQLRNQQNVSNLTRQGTSVPSSQLVARLPR